MILDGQHCMQAAYADCKNEVFSMVDVCLLGCGGMMPLPERKLTAMLYRFGGQMILVDCGEGTQVQIKLSGWGFKPIGALLFTHYHADHAAGLPGFLLTLANNGRTDPLMLFGPPGLMQLVRGLTVLAPELPYKLVVTELSEDALQVFRIGNVLVHCAPAYHGMPCLAYSLEIVRKGRFDTARALALGIPVWCWNWLQQGETVQHEGRIYTPEMVLGLPRKGIKVTYCTDSRPTEAIASLCMESDLFICEGIYGEDEKLQGAIDKKHMIFSEAAALAKAGGVKELWLTHYSPSLKNPDDYLDRTKTIFENTRAGQNLMKKTLNFE